jgi:hypothetical protein
MIPFPATYRALIHCLSVTHTRAKEIIPFSRLLNSPSPHIFQVALLDLKHAKTPASPLHQLILDILLVTIGSKQWTYAQPFFSPGMVTVYAVAPTTGSPSPAHQAVPLRQQISSTYTHNPATSSPSPHPNNNTTTMAHQGRSPSPPRPVSLRCSPPPPGGPQETCFFWIHGQCRKGSLCEQKHELRASWPITVPPGWKHFYPCRIFWCPLRTDLVALAEKQGWVEHRSLRAYDHDSDHEDYDEDLAEVEHTIGRMAAEVDAEGDEIERLAVAVDPITKAKKLETGLALGRAKIAEGQARLAREALPTNVSRSNVDDGGAGIVGGTNVRKEVEVIEISSDSDKNEIIDISSDSSGARKRKKRTKKRGTKKEGKRPRLDPADNIVPPPPPNLELPTRPAQSLQVMTVEHEPGAPNTQSQTDLQGPQAVKLSSSICFHWYHEGDCKPCIRNGQPTVCSYVHTLDSPVQHVNRPRDCNTHDTRCPLPLCPFRSPDLVMSTTASLARINFDKRPLHLLLNATPNSRKKPQPARVIEHQKKMLGLSAEEVAELEKNQIQEKGLLVDYDLPEGEDRADWVSILRSNAQIANSEQDTDTLRRAFHEIM